MQTELDLEYGFGGFFDTAASYGKAAISTGISLASRAIKYMPVVAAAKVAQSVYKVGPSVTYNKIINKGADVIGAAVKITTGSTAYQQPKTATQLYGARPVSLAQRVVTNVNNTKWAQQSAAVLQRPVQQLRAANTAVIQRQETAVVRQAVARQVAARPPVLASTTVSSRPPSIPAQQVNLPEVISEPRPKSVAALFVTKPEAATANDRKLSYDARTDVIDTWRELPLVEKERTKESALNVLSLRYPGATRENLEYKLVGPDVVKAAAGVGKLVVTGGATLLGGPLLGLGVGAAWEGGERLLSPPEPKKQNTTGGLLGIMKGNNQPDRTTKVDIHAEARDVLARNRAAGVLVDEIYNNQTNTIEQVRPDGTIVRSIVLNGKVVASATVAAGSPVAKASGDLLRTAPKGGNGNIEYYTIGSSEMARLPWNGKLYEKKAGSWVLIDDPKDYGETGVHKSAGMPNWAGALAATSAAGLAMLTPTGLAGKAAITAGLTAAAKTAFDLVDGGIARMQSDPIAKKVPVLPATSPIKQAINELTPFEQRPYEGLFPGMTPFIQTQYPWSGGPAGPGYAIRLNLGESAPASMVDYSQQGPPVVSQPITVGGQSFTGGGEGGTVSSPSGGGGGGGGWGATQQDSGIFDLGMPDATASTDVKKTEDGMTPLLALVGAYLLFS